MTLPIAPRASAEDLERTRDEWLQAVEQLVSEAEAWSQQQGFATRRESKRVSDGELGEYDVPQLLVHGPAGRLLLDPITRFIAGGSGLVELCVLPSFDSVPIVRTDAGWQIRPPGVKRAPRPWESEAFFETVRELLASA